MDVRASIKVWVEFYLNWQLILWNLDTNNLVFYFLFFIYLSLIDKKIRLAVYGYEICTF